MFKKKIFIMVMITGISLLLIFSLAHSADYPQKPVKLIATADAGGTEDSLARGVAPYLEKYLQVSVTVENQPGAGGKIAFEKFQKTKPDGYSLVVFTFPKSIIIEHISKVNFSTKDFTPIFTLCYSNSVLLVHSDTWKTFPEFLNAAKAKTMSGGLSGRGSTTHLTGLLAMDELGLKVNWVPYEGGPGSLAALAGKHLDFTITPIDTASSLIRAGKLRPLLLFSDKRSLDFQDVPIPKDLGYNFTLPQVIRCVMAPPNTPPSIVKVLEEAFYKTVKEPAFMEWAQRKKIDIDPLSAKEFGKIVEAVYPKIANFQDLLKQ